MIRKRWFLYLDPNPGASKNDPTEPDIADLMGSEFDLLPMKHQTRLTYIFILFLLRGVA